MQRIHARQAQGKAGQAEVPFTHVIIDDHAPVNQWATGVGDINGDGYVDVASSGSTVGRGGLYWYEYPTWAKHVIDATGGFSDDMQLVDGDGDGDLDIVVPEDGSKEVRWYENPRSGGNPATNPWKVHVIGSYAEFGFEEAHDVEVADLNGDRVPSHIYSIPPGDHHGSFWLRFRFQRDTDRSSGMKGAPGQPEYLEAPQSKHFS